MHCGAWYLLVSCSATEYVDGALEACANQHTVGNSSVAIKSEGHGGTEGVTRFLREKTLPALGRQSRLLGRRLHFRHAFGPEKHQGQFRKANGMCCEMAVDNIQQRPAQYLHQFQATHRGARLVVLLQYAML